MDKKSYKELEEELHEVMQRVEGARYDDIDALLKDYETGKTLIEALESHLERAKNTILKAK